VDLDLVDLVAVETLMIVLEDVALAAVALTGAVDVAVDVTMIRGLPS
jgi:hypothetical protein